MDSTGWLLGASLLVLLCLSAFFSASETAFSSLNKIRMKNYAQDGDRKAKRALGIAEDFDKTLSTILVGNNVVNMASASIATVLATALFGASGAAIATFVMTALVLIFGEILPKSFAMENSEKVALSVGGLLAFLIKLLSPVVFVFLKIKEVAKHFLSHREEQPSVTEEELKYIIESIEEEGVLEEQESDLVQSALDFDEITVQEILVPRVDVVAVNVDDSLEEATQTVLEEHYSRIPVYRGTIDNIIGIVKIRDLLEVVVRKKQSPLKNLVTDCLYVHKTMKISSLLSEMKAKKLQFAVVSDDYGGTMGIVTMEDILEELVGEIWDETDEVIHELVQTDKNTYLVNGDMNIFELFDQLDISDKDFKSEYNTVGGWALEMLGHIPVADELFTYKNMKITVMVVEEQRILSLRVEVTPQKIEDAAADGGRRRKDDE